MSSLPLVLPPSPFPQSLAASLGLLVLSEANSFYTGSAAFKSLASFSFFLAGAQNGPFKTLQSFSYTNPTTRYPYFMILGLGFCVAGDLLLIPAKEHYYAHRKSAKVTPAKSEGDSLSFKAGTFFFALGHISYIIAFASNPNRTPFRLLPFGLAAAFGLGVSRWLGIFGSSANSNPKLVIPADMKPLVKAYVSIITTMVGVATATDAGWQRTLGAWMFMISDLFVAVDVFGRKKGVKAAGKGRPGWVFRSVGWGFYFTANLILAGTV